MKEALQEIGIEVTQTDRNQLAITRYIAEAEYYGHTIQVDEIMPYAIRIRCDKTGKELVISYQHMVMLAYELGLLAEEA